MITVWLLVHRGKFRTDTAASRRNRPGQRGPGVLHFVQLLISGLTGSVRYGYTKVCRRCTPRSDGQISVQKEMQQLPLWSSF